MRAAISPPKYPGAAEHGPAGRRVFSYRRPPPPTRAPRQTNNGVVYRMCFILLLLLRVFALLQYRYWNIVSGKRYGWIRFWNLISALIVPTRFVPAAHTLAHPFTILTCTLWADISYYFCSCCCCCCCCCHRRLNSPLLIYRRYRTTLAVVYY